jgi:outer membrane phospholipase A
MAMLATPALAFAQAVAPAAEPASMQEPVTAETTAPAAPAPPEAAAPPVAAAPPAAGPPVAAATKGEDEPELDVLTFHRSNYALTGFNRNTQVKFQFSFKYDLWPSTSHHTVYLAYTQKSLWDLYDTSSPFRESNYAPEIFYAHYHSQLHGQPDPGCNLFSEAVGFEHESNGEAGDVSRSWNRAFVDGEAACYGKLAYGLVGVRAWYPFGLAENKHIVKTQGYGELMLGVGVDHVESHMNGLISVVARKGTSHALRKGSLTIDARWRPTYQRLIGKAWKFAPYLWFQLFTGYGETLASYDRSTTSARLGIGFTDRAR